MSAQPSRTALIVIAGDREPSVLEARRRWVQPDRGIPPHITVLFPFVPASELDEGTLGSLRRLFGAIGPFDFVLGSVASFPDAVWLAPEPSAPFVDLISATRMAFPAYPPYGDPAAGAPVPHCTVRTLGEHERPDAALRDVRSWFQPHLPIRCRAEAVVLLAEHDDGTWSQRAAFPFERAA